MQPSAALASSKLVHKHRPLYCYQSAFNYREIQRKKTVSNSLHTARNCNASCHGMSRYNFIFLVIFFTFVLQGPPSTPATTDEQYRKLGLFRSHLYDSFHHLQNATYDQSPRNLTGFMLSYQDVLDGAVNQTYPLPGKDYDHWANNQEYSILPDTITKEAQDVWSLEQDEHDPDSNYYTNISSSSKGRFTLSNDTLVSLPLVLPDYLSHFNEDFSIPSSETVEYANKVGNVTMQSGVVRMDITVVDTINKKFFNSLDSKVKIINIDFEVSDDDESDKHLIETKGFYFIETGNIVTSSSSAKFFSLYGGLQHLTFDESNFDAAKNVSIEYLSENFFKTPEEKNFDISFNYLQQVLEQSEQRCEYISYFHLNKVGLSKDQITEIDDELKSPIGRPISLNSIPGMNFTGLLYSPDCAVKLQLPTLTGPRREVKIFRYHRATIVGIVVLFIQILLTVKQLNYTSTPSTISRISFWAVCLMSLVDGSLAMIYLVASAIFNQLYLPLTVSAFLSFILASMFEMRFMINIYMSQINERTLSLSTALQGRPMDDSDDSAPAATGGEPQDEAQVSGAIYTRFFFALIIFTFIMLNSIVWPRHIREGFERVVLLVLNSYWLPQAYRNVVRGSHRSFKWWFIIGTTLVRLTPIGYIFMVKNNVFDHHVDRRYFLVLVIWVSLQLSLLALQSVFGARFFLPKSWLPQTYSYHPALTEGDLEHGFGINHFHPEGESSEGVVLKTDNGTCFIDCAICMNEVEVPILKSNLDQAATFLQRRQYMVTPCRHIFHTQCLEAWMKYKLQCPVCRNSLPPL